MDPFLRRRRIIHENNHARNQRFQLPAFPKANQNLWHCSNSQSALRPKSGRNEHKRERVCIRPNFSGIAVRENVREPFRLGQNRWQLHSQVCFLFVNEQKPSFSNHFSLKTCAILSISQGKVNFIIQTKKSEGRIEQVSQENR